MCEILSSERIKRSLIDHVEHFRFPYMSAFHSSSFNSDSSFQPVLIAKLGVYTNNNEPPKVSRKQGLPNSICPADVPGPDMKSVCQ